MKKNINQITFFNFLSTVLLQGLAFFTGPIFSAVLGTNNYGIATTYLTWVQVASIVFPLGATGALALARVKYPLEDQPKYQSSVLSLATFSYLCFSTVTLLFVVVTSPWTDISLPMVVAGILQGWGSCCVGCLNAKFTYEFQAGKNLILSLTVSVLTIGSSLVLVHMLPAEVNYWGRIIGQSAIYAVIGTVVFIYLLKRGKVVYSKEYWRFTLPVTVPTVFHSLANTILHQCSKLLLQNMLDNSAVGIFGLSCTFGGILNTVWNALNHSWVPFYYEYTRTNQIAEMRRHAKNYIELFTIISMGFILLAREVFHLYAKESFWSGTDFIPLFALGYYFVFLYSFPVNYEFFHKKTRMIAVVTTCSAVANIVLNIIFIKMFGIFGAVIASTAAYGLQFAFHFISAKRLKVDTFPFKLLDFIPGLLAVIGICVFYMFTRELWLVRWGIGAALGVYMLLKIIKRKEIF